MIRVEGLDKRFGAFHAVRTVDFTAPSGRITTLLGPSGSGKSTVLRIIAGLEHPDGGRVHLGEADATELPPQKRNVGLVFQSYALFGHLSVRDNVGFGLDVRKVPRAERDARIDELLSLVQLEAYADRMPTQLSGGQKQRVALARALAPRPGVLLLDEPFAALDARVRRELREFLRQLTGRLGVTTLLVTHDQEEALELSDVVVVMHEGRVEQIGSPTDIYDHPSSAFVAGFVGAAAVLEGRVDGDRATMGQIDLPAQGQASGSTVQAFVRPHDVAIVGRAEEAGAGESVTSAEVVRLVWLGWTVKAYVRLDDGQEIAVQLTRQEATTLGIEAGHRVLVNVQKAQLFVMDYSI